MRVLGDISKELAALSQEQAALSGRLTALATEVALGSSSPTPPMPAHEPVADTLMTVDQVARETGFTTDYIYDQIRRGELRCVRMGKYRRPKRSAVAEWIAAHEHRGQHGDILLPSAHANNQSRTRTEANGRH